MTAIPPSTMTSPPKPESRDAPTSFRPDVFQVNPPALLGSQCTRCTRRTFPPRDVCPHCAAVDGGEPARLSTEGVVYSFTVVRQAPPGLRTPYVLGYVDLPDEEIRVLSRIEGVEPGEMQIGMPVRLVTRPDERDGEGASVMFAFAPSDRRAARQ